jgi:predicted dehydrogenase
MDKKIKVVMVGCGGMSGAWLTPATEFEDIEIVGLMDLKLENAEKAKEKHKLDNAIVGTSLSELIDSTGAEAVFDCTVPEAHVKITLEAIAKGCHVLGEKPMADSMGNARKMLEAAVKNKRTYAVIQNRRYMDSIIACRDLIKSGAIGKATTFNADFYLGPHFGGFREEMDHVLLLDMAIHSFDQARYLSGADAVSVYCHEWNPGNSWYHHGASAMVIFEMSDGSVFNYRGSWCAEGLGTSWQCDWRVVGEKGTMLWDGEDGIKAQQVIYKEGKGETVDLEIPKKAELAHTGHSGLIREFIDCLKDGSTPQTICTDNIKSLAMVHAAIESAETGKKVNIK